jgi:hypothetical protein
LVPPKGAKCGRTNRDPANQEYLQDSRVKLFFERAYAPDLKLTERLRRFFEKQLPYKPN